MVRREAPARRMLRPFRKTDPVATLTELAKLRTELQRDELAHLQRLVAEWGMLADFCFADLLLFAPSTKGRWIVLGQVRPVTGQTIFQADLVGTWARDSERPVLTRAAGTGEMVEADVDVDGLPAPTHVLAVPVRFEGRVIAVMSRVQAPGVGRAMGELETTYLSVFERLAAM